MRLRKLNIPQLLLNNITGKIGGIILRKRYGKTIISAVPINYRKSNSEKSVNNRKRFAVISGIATALNNVPEFKELWKVIAKNKMSSHNAAAKYVARQIRKDGVPEITSIFPSDFSTLKCSLVRKDKSGFSILVDYSSAFESSAENRPVNSARNNKVNVLNSGKHIRVFALFIMKDSAYFSDRYKVFCSDFHELDETKKDLIVETNFYDTDSSTMNEYNNIQVRYAALLYDKNKSLLHVSNTFQINEY
ncbi:MAG: hypothetical protein WCK13_10615 [Ignavibacteriota bacterium]